MNYENISYFSLFLLFLQISLLFLAEATAHQNVGGSGKVLSESSSRNPKRKTFKQIFVQHRSGKVLVKYNTYILEYLCRYTESLIFYIYLIFTFRHVLAICELYRICRTMRGWRWDLFTRVCKNTLD